MHAQRKPSAVERLERLTRVREDGCWEFTGRLNENGYGSFSVTVAGEMIARQAHRAAYVLFVAPVPEGMEVDHACHSRLTCPGGKGCMHRRCVNPIHLEVVSHRENTRRGVGSKTHCPHGHSLDDALITAAGHRRCRTCDQQRVAAFYEQQKQARAHCLVCGLEMMRRNLKRHLRVKHSLQAALNPVPAQEKREEKT